MKELYIFLITLVLAPIISLMLFKLIRGKKRINNSISLGAFLLLLLVIISKISKISFSQDSIKFIFVSIVYLGVCYLIWNLIYQRQQLLKAIGIVVAVIVFGIGLVIAFAGTSVLDNKQKDPIFVKNFDGFEVKLDLFATKPQKIYKVFLNRKTGPFDKLLLKKEYINTIPEKYDSIEADYNKKDNELILKYWYTINNRNIVVWRDTIR